MDENQYLINVWKVIAAGIVGLAAVIGGCVGHTDYRISEAIKSGADPISTYCALSSNTTDARCIAVAVSRK